MTQEVWMPVVGFEGLYSASSLGRVMSLTQTSRGNRRYERGPIVMKLRKGGTSAYPIVGLVKNSVRSTHLVHRLVAGAFHDNPLGYEQVNHKDGNKDNNRADNLEWVTRSQNAVHSYNVLGQPGSGRGKFGVLCKKHRVIEQRNLDGTLLAVWHGALEASRALVMDQSAIHKACKGARRNVYRGFSWSYAEPRAAA